METKRVPIIRQVRVMESLFSRKLIPSCLVAVFITGASPVYSQQIHGEKSLTPKGIVQIIQDDSVPDSKKIIALQVLLKLKPQLSDENKKILSHYLIPIIVEKKSPYSEAAMKILTDLNLSVSKSDALRLIESLLAPDLGAKRKRMAFHLLYCNGFYTKKLQLDILKAAEGTKSPEDASVLLSCANELPYPRSGELDKFITPTANLDSYWGRETLYSNVAMTSSSFPENKPFDKVLFHVVFKNKKFALYFLVNNCDLFQRGFTWLLTDSDNTSTQIEIMDRFLQYVTSEKESQKVVASFFAFLNNNDFASPYYARNHWGACLELGLNAELDQKDKKNIILYFNKVTLSSQYDKLLSIPRQRPNLELIAYKKLVDSTAQIKERYLAFSLLQGYNYYFKNLELPNDFPEKLFELVKNKKDVPFIRIQALCLLDSMKQYGKNIASELMDLRKNKKQYPELRVFFDRQ